jgi:hypothetical protein
MTHELSHVIGLSHEHQRPGFTDRLNLDIQWFSGYNTKLGTIMNAEASQEPAFRGMNNGCDRLNLLSKDYGLAKCYWPEIQDWVPHDHSV